MNKKGIIILSLIGIIAFCLRVIPHWNMIFPADGVVFFLDTDSYWHMRAVDYLIQNYPQPISYDYYAFFPDGSLPYFRPMLSFIIATISLILGLGHPTSQLVNTVGAFVPPVLGVITVFLSFWLAKVTFRSNFIAYIAAFLVAIYPTESLHRSMLGYADHHVLELVFGLLTTICIIKMDTVKKIWWAVAAGISLAALHYTWPGAPLWGGIICLWFIIAFFWRYWKNGYDTDLRKLSANTAIMFAVTLTLIVPLIPGSQTGMDIAIGAYPVLIFLMMGVAAKLKAKIGIPIMAGVAGLALILIAVLKPSLFDPIVYQFNSVFWGFGSTILEAMPSDLGMIYYFFGIAAIFALIGLVFAFIKKEHGLFITLAIVFSLLMIGQRRWAYIATVPIVILAAYGIIKLSSIFSPLIKWVSAFTAVFVIICATMPAQAGLLRVNTDITPAWYNACTWLRANTPEPFESYAGQQAAKQNDFLLATNATAIEYVPKADYAVLSWWDYGHFIIRIGHRVPMANPAAQINVPAFRFLLSQTDAEAEQYDFASKVKYIVIDNYMVSSGDKNGVGTKFYAMVKQAALEGAPDWRKVLPNSLVRRLYVNEETDYYFKVYQSGDVKIFERKGVSDALE